MSIHPNVILMAILQPDDLPMKTLRALREHVGIKGEEDAGEFSVEGQDTWNLTLMEGSYDDGWQIAAPTGSIVVHDFLTYGYGDTIEWEKVVAIVERLKAWCAGLPESLHIGKFEIKITANYW